MKIWAEDNEIVLSDVYNGIGIETDSGTYGISQRDSGIEIMHNGCLIISLNGKVATVYDETVVERLEPPKSEYDWKGSLINTLKVGQPIFHREGNGWWVVKAKNNEVISELEGWPTNDLLAFFKKHGVWNEKLVKA